MPRVEVRLTDDEKKAWKEYCHSVDETEANMLRKIIADMTNQVRNEPVILEKKLKTKNITVALSDDDRVKMGEKMAMKKYRTPTQWMRSLIRADLDKEPILPDDAIHALRASNRELGAIGRNLNQIARALNSDTSHGDKLKLDAIKLLSKRIEEHKIVVSKLINYNDNPLAETV